ncbi:MAG: GNAT family N-acetyltransferase [Gemmiger sp.]|nr:GNAT family N-acetyltransferase [Gemmiger sp.]
MPKAEANEKSILPAQNQPRLTVESARLTLRPYTLGEMEGVMAAEADPEMRQAYAEMLAAMRALPGREEWGAEWQVALRDGLVTIGGIGFKGPPDAAGRVELGYGIDLPYQGNGYATEAVQALVNWCWQQPGVAQVLAQTEPGNATSQRVLAKCGFVRDGNGEEGPMFSRTNPARATQRE